MILLTDEKPKAPTAINTAVRRAATSLLLLLVTLGFVFVVTEPDERVTGWMSNDKPVMEGK